MSPDQQAKWDSWLNGRLYNFFDTVGVDWLAKVLADERKQTSEQLQAEVAKLNRQLVITRAKTEMLRSELETCRGAIKRQGRLARLLAKVRRRVP